MRFCARKVLFITANVHRGRVSKRVMAILESSHARSHVRCVPSVSLLHPWRPLCRHSGPNAPFRCPGAGSRGPLPVYSEHGSNGVSCSCSIKTPFTTWGSTDRNSARTRPKRVARRIALVAESPMSMIETKPDAGIAGLPVLSDHRRVSLAIHLIGAPRVERDGRTLPAPRGHKVVSKG